MTPRSPDPPTDRNPPRPRLPAWVASPDTQPGRTTLAWRLAESARSTRVWQLFSRLYGRFAERNRFASRHPVLGPSLAVVLSWVVTLALVLLVYFLFQVAIGVYH